MKKIASLITILVTTFIITIVSYVLLVMEEMPTVVRVGCLIWQMMYYTLLIVIIIHLYRSRNDRRK